jgi:hypothetical protein
VSGVGNRRAAAVFLGCAAIALVIFSCTNGPPKIVQTFWQLNLVNDVVSGQRYERLTVFVHLDDQVDLSDLDALYVLNDTAELFWKIDQSNWIVEKEDGETWIGTNNIRSADGNELPRGTYRILLSNLAGERTPGEIFVGSEKRDLADAVFPKLAISAGTVEIRSPYSEQSIWVYDESGKLLAARAVSSASATLHGLVSNDASFRTIAKLYAYGYDKSCGCGMLSGPYAP